jgi:ubiquinone/menaquinone biosynthesis C-methylase UbiE
MAIMTQDPSDHGAEPEAAGARKQHWNQVFREKSEGEVSWFQASPRLSLEMIGRAGLGSGAGVVDVGGGASRLVDALLEQGYQNLTVLDIAGSALEQSKQRLGPKALSVSWVTSDVASWAPETRYDLWHDRAVFHFSISPEDQAAYLATMHRALKIGGQAIIATFDSHGPERCSGLPVRRYEPEALAAKLGPAFELLETVRERHSTPGGKEQSFQYSRFVRRG